MLTTLWRREESSDATHSSRHEKISWTSLSYAFSSGTVRWGPSDLELSPTSLRLDLCSNKTLTLLVPMSIPSSKGSILPLYLRSSHLHAHKGSWTLDARTADKGVAGQVHVGAGLVTAAQHPFCACAALLFDAKRKFEHEYPYRGNFDRSSTNMGVYIPTETRWYGTILDCLLILNST